MKKLKVSVQRSDLQDQINAWATKVRESEAMNHNQEIFDEMQDFLDELEALSEMSR